MAGRAWLDPPWTAGVRRIYQRPLITGHSYVGL